MNTAFMADVLGWIGAAALLAAYAMLSFRRISAQDGIFHGLNIFGSFLLIINTAYQRAYPSAVVNVIWIAVAVLTRMRANPKVATALRSVE